MAKEINYHRVGEDLFSINPTYYTKTTTEQLECLKAIQNFIWERLTEIIKEKGKVNENKRFKTG